MILPTLRREGSVPVMLATFHILTIIDVYCIYTSYRNCMFKYTVLYTQVLLFSIQLYEFWDYFLLLLLARFDYKNVIYINFV